MKAAEWIDKIKVIKGWDSDYRAAKELGITRGGMSQIRTGESLTLREDTAIKVAKVLGLNPAGIVIDQMAERSKDDGVRTTLHKMAGELCILCKVSLAIIFGATHAHHISYRA